MLVLSAKWCALEYFIARSRPLIYVKKKRRPENTLGTPYMLVRSELRPFIEVY